MKSILSLLALSGILGGFLPAPPAFGLEDLFRADFGNLPTGSQPLAHVGTLSTNPAFSVETGDPVLSYQFLRIDASAAGSLGLQWIPVLTPSTGDFSFQCRLRLSEEPDPGDLVFLTGLFGLPGDTSRSVPLLAFGPGGALEFNSSPIAATWETGTVYRIRMDYSLSTGRADLYLDDVLAATSFSEYRTGHALRIAFFSISSGYDGILDLDELAIVHAQPWVTHLRANFDANPLGDLLGGSIPGYPVQDEIPYAIREPAPVDTLAVETASAWSRHLSLQNNNPTGLPVAVTFTPNRDPLEEGVYRLLFDLERSSTSGQVDVSLLGDSFSIFVLRFSGLNLGVTSNQTILPLDYPIPAGVVHRFDARLDTVEDTYSLTINGIPVFSNWPAARIDLPSALTIATDTNATGLYYFDEIALERRGRQGLYIFRRNVDFPGLLRANPLTRSIDYDSRHGFSAADPLSYQNCTFGPDGNLLVMNTHSNQYGIWICDPTTLLPLSFWSNALFHPVLRGIAVRPDGSILVHAADSQDGPARLERFDADYQWVESLASPLNGSADMHISHDGTRLLFSRYGNVHVHDAWTGANLHLLSTVQFLNLDAIDDMAVGPDNRLHILCRADDMIYMFDHALDSVYALYELPDAFDCRDITVLPNGNLALFDSINGQILEVDRHSVVMNGAYDLGGASIATVASAVAAPLLHINSIDADDPGAMGLHPDAESGRFYDIRATTNLPDGVWSAGVTNAFASNACPRLAVTNPPASRLRFYRLRESGLP